MVSSGGKNAGLSELKYSIADGSSKLKFRVAD